MEPQNTNLTKMKYAKKNCAETEGAENDTPKLAKTFFLDNNCRHGES